jgi:hypothetical protein
MHLIPLLVPASLAREERSFAFAFEPITEPKGKTITDANNELRSDLWRTAGILEGSKMPTGCRNLPAAPLVFTNDQCETLEKVRQ